MDKVRKSCLTEATQMNHKHHEPKCTSLQQPKNNKSHSLLKPPLHLICAEEIVLITCQNAFKYIQDKKFRAQQKLAGYWSAIISLGLSAYIQWMTQRRPLKKNIVGDSG